MTFSYIKPMRRMAIDQRGDTIVEVLFAIAILGAVLGSAYVVVNRNVATNRESQERLEAVKVAEGQFERLKVKTASDPSLFDASGFCLTPANVDVSQTSASCKVSATGAPTVSDPQYRISITKVANVAIGANATAGTRFMITIKWANFRGSGDDSLDYLYEIYR